MNPSAIYRYGLLIAIPFWLNREVRQWHETTGSWTSASWNTVTDPTFWICVILWPLFLIGAIDDLTRKI